MSNVEASGPGARDANRCPRARPEKVGSAVKVDQNFSLKGRTSSSIVQALGS